MLFGILLTNVFAQNTPGETTCNPDDIKAGLSDPIVFPNVRDAIHANCPALDGIEHSDQQDCECAEALRENADFLRFVPAFNCVIDGQSLIDGWALDTQAKCNAPVVNACDRFAEEMKPCCYTPWDGEVCVKEQENADVCRADGVGGVPPNWETRGTWCPQTEMAPTTVTLSSFLRLSKTLTSVKRPMTRAPPSKAKSTPISKTATAPAWLWTMPSF